MEDSKYVTIEAHTEFAKRMDAENDRQNHRIASLEKTVQEIQRLTVSVEKMAVSMENMTQELKTQSSRLDKIEKEPADTWKKMSWEVLKYVVVAIIAIAAAKIGLTI